MTFDELTAPKQTSQVDISKLEFYGKEALSDPRLAKEAIVNFDFLVFDSHENWSRLLRLDQASPSNVSWIEIPREFDVKGVLTGEQLMNLVTQMELNTLTVKRNIIILKQGEENK